MLRLPAPLLDAIRRHAAQTWPLECCGLLIGRRQAGRGNGDIAVSEQVACRNVAGQPARTFEVDPQARFEAERRLRGTNDAVVGHYHSHPGGPARPSATDLKLAFEPGLVWLIVAVDNGEAGDARAFRLVDGAFQEIAVTSAD